MPAEGCSESDELTQPLIVDPDVDGAATLVVFKHVATGKGSIRTGAQSKWRIPCGERYPRRLGYIVLTRFGSGYKGRNFMPAHAKVAPIHAEQISRWLSLFQETPDEPCDSEASEALFDIAKRMAESQIGLSPELADEPRN